MISKIHEIKARILNDWLCTLNNKRFLEKQNRIDMILPFTPKLEYNFESPFYDDMDQIFGSVIRDNIVYVLKILTIPPEYIQDGYGHQQIIDNYTKRGVPLYWLSYPFNSNIAIYQDALRHYDGRELYDLTDFLEMDINYIKHEYDHQYERNDIDKAFDLIQQDILESVFLLI